MASSISKFATLYETISSAKDYDLDPPLLIPRGVTIKSCTIDIGSTVSNVIDVSLVKGSISIPFDYVYSKESSQDRVHSSDILRNTSKLLEYSPYTKIRLTPTYSTSTRTSANSGCSIEIEFNEAISQEPPAKILAKQSNSKYSVCWMPPGYEGSGVLYKVYIQSSSGEDNLTIDAGSEIELSYDIPSSHYGHTSSIYVEAITSLGNAVSETVDVEVKENVPDTPESGWVLCSASLGVNGKWVGI